MHLSQRDLANKVGVSVNTIQSYEGGSLPRGPHFLTLAKALGCSLNWLVDMNDLGNFQWNTGQVSVLPGGDSINSSEPLGSLDYFFQPVFLNSADDESSKYRTVSFNYRWLSDISSKPENVRLVAFKGPSMEPALFDGDLLMVDLGLKTVMK